VFAELVDAHCVPLPLPQQIDSKIIYNGSFMLYAKQILEHGIRQRNFQHLASTPIQWYINDKSLKGFSNLALAAYLLRVNRISGLSSLLKVKVIELEDVLNTPNYRLHRIPKKRGGWRVLEEPAPVLKRMQRRMNIHLQGYYAHLKPASVTGFVIAPKAPFKLVNVMQNAIPHVGKQHLLNIDLKDFFQSISAKRIYALLSGVHFQFDKQIAIALSLLCTYKGHLPTGAPSSPILSNWVCLELDWDLQAFCEQYGLTYSRYADDLSFSANEPIARTTVEALVNLIEKHDFRVNRRKMRLVSAHRQQVVTGIVVNKRPNIDRKQLKKIRAMLHDAETSGLEKATSKHLSSHFITHDQQELFLNRLQGYINWVGQVRGLNDPMHLRFTEGLLRVLKKRNRE